MERKGSPAPKKASKLSPTAKPFRSASRSGSGDSSSGGGDAKPLPPRPEGGRKKAAKPCRFFQQGNCKRGADCQFLHEAVAAAPVPAPVAVALVAPAPVRLLQEQLDSDSSSGSMSAASEDGAPTYVCPFCQVCETLVFFFCEVASF
jgi:hypothetical protein